MSKITNDGLTRSGTRCFYSYGNSERQRVKRAVALLYRPRSRMSSECWRRWSGWRTVTVYVASLVDIGVVRPLSTTEISAGACRIYVTSKHILLLRLLTLWRPLLPYGYSYKASCARLG